LCLSYGQDHEGPDRSSKKEKKGNLKPAVGSTAFSLSTFDCKPSDQILMSQNAHSQKEYATHEPRMDSLGTERDPEPHYWNSENEYDI
jgi:hypothetical protein